MSDISNSTPVNLPTSKQLIRSTIVAIIVAAVLLVAVVMPAEYGVDPTGIGDALGLTEMGRIKVSLAKEAAEQESQTAAATAQPAGGPAPPAATTDTNAGAPAAASQPPATTGRRDTMAVSLAPGEGREIKLEMREGARVRFSWSTDRGVVNYDQHADSVTPKRDYFGYRKGSAVANDEGELVAAFDGSHGWFWRNRGSQDVTVTLRTEGDYSSIAERK